MDIQHRNEDDEVYTFEALTEQVDRSITRVPQEWIRTPGTQYLLARLYGSILPEGFKLARTACQRAIFEEDKDDQVPIAALQLLGNLEARQAEALSAEAETLLSDSKTSRNAAEKQRLTELSQRQFAEAVALSDNAIERLQGLLKITDQMHALGSGNGGSPLESFTPNAERFALLGSAFKYKAIVLCRRGDPWSTIQPLLEQSAEAYGDGEGVSFDYNFDPYAMINRLQLCGVLGGDVANYRQLIDKAQEASRQAFSHKPGFFSAVNVADAEVASYLISGDSLIEFSPDEPDEARLIRIYHEAVREVPRNHRQFLSTVKQLICMAGFLDKRADSLEDGSHINHRARVLKAVALELKKM